MPKDLVVVGVEVRVLVVDIETVVVGVPEGVNVARAAVSKGEREAPRHSLLAPKIRCEVIDNAVEDAVIVIVHAVPHFPGKVRPNLNVRAKT